MFNFSIKRTKKYTYFIIILINQSKFSQSKVYSTNPILSSCNVQTVLPTEPESAHNLILLCFLFIFVEKGRVSPYFGRPQLETSNVCKKYGWDDLGSEDETSKTPERTFFIRFFCIPGICLSYNLFLKK